MKGTILAIYHYSNKLLLIGLLLVFVSAIVIAVTILTPQKIDTTSITIILAPHADDAALSLGGMMAQYKRQTLVAAFFTTNTDTRVGLEGDSKRHTEAMNILSSQSQNFSYASIRLENVQPSVDIQSEISRDIQSLIVAHGNKTIYMYAPAIFSGEINDPDHTLLHNAFVDVVSLFPDSNIHFYFYEDYPYTDAFNATSGISLKKNLENEVGVLVEAVPIVLGASDVDRKSAALGRYLLENSNYTIQDRGDIVTIKDSTERRCGSEGACEVVYEIKRF